jgi:initiation factor 1A
VKILADVVQLPTDNFVRYNALLSYISYVSEYAQVTKMLGNGRLEAMCFDGVKRLCHIRGKLRKKVGFL